MSLPAQAHEPPPPDDRWLAKRAAAGEEAAFRSLYDRHAARVFALCMRLSKGRTEATELLQDTWVRAWESIGAFRGEAAFSSWLHRIAVRLAWHRDRGDRRREARVSLTDDLATLDGRADAPAVVDRLDLEAAIAALPPSARTVFVLHVVEGYPHDAIAEWLGIAVGTSKAHVHRARTLLKRWLAP
jgi:RNA polymerase sigma-70 factor (ECF subfamily)